MDAPSLSGEHVALRALTDADVPRVAEMNALPEVARWWNPRDSEYLESKVRNEELACWVVEVNGELAGFVQAYEHEHREFRHAGLDLFLHPGLHGRGLGPRRGANRLPAPRGGLRPPSARDRPG